MEITRCTTIGRLYPVAFCTRIFEVFTLIRIPRERMSNQPFALKKKLTFLQLGSLCHKLPRLD